MYEVKQVIEILSSMPSWADEQVLEVGLFPKIKTDMQLIARQNMETIKEAMMDYINMASKSSEGYSTLEMGKLFVLNRYLFNVPQFEKLDRPGFGGFLGIPVENGRVNMLWPLVNEASELVLRYGFKGYSGESYLAMQELQYFQKRYGVRSR